ncbi:MAG: M20/M25/M40 family metallo-hydrolase [Phycisphaeraceae bacterium]
MATRPPIGVIELLQRMVREDSVNTALTGRPRAEADLATLLAEIAEQWGLATAWLPVEGQADQLLVTCRVGHDRPWVLFDSHLDTVAVDNMTVDPFVGEVIDGRVVGRGACDTKGTGAAMLWALKRYAEASDRPNNVALLFSVDEEISMTGIQQFVDAELPKLGWSPRLVIVGEPTEHVPVVAHNGCVRWTIETRGKAAHSSTPWEGRSAISDMVKVLTLLQRDYIDRLDAEHDLTGRAVASVNLISGGSAPNIIPERCVCEVDRRVVPGEDHAAVLPTVAKLIDTLCAADRGFAYSQTLQVAHPPLLADSSAAVLPAVKAALIACGVRKPAVGAPFATHAGYLAQAGLPTLVLGPGSPHPAHTKDEWVSVDEIKLGVRVYQTLMTSDWSASDPA